MGTCPRCGQLNRPGSIACMACGSSLAQPASAPVAADDGLPGWLRQLQSSQPQGVPQPQQPQQPQGAPQAYSTSGGFAQPQPQQPPPSFGMPPQPLSAGSLVSDDALPDWLRAAGQSAAPQNAQPPAAWGAGAASAGWHEAQPPAGYLRGYAPQPGQRQGQGMGYGAVQRAPLTSGPLSYNQPANSLFDDTALPDWLREASNGHAPEAQPPTSAFAQPPAPSYGTSYGGYAPPPSGYSEYGAPQSSALPPPASTAFPSIDQVGQHQPPRPGQAGLSGHALYDTGALPPWLSGQAGADAIPGAPANSSGMNAQSLIDESALPQWLRAEQAASAASSPTAASRNVPAAHAEPLPAWLDQMYADANVARIEPQPGATAWGAQAAAPVPPPAARPPMVAGGAGISAGDFVDESALPDWLRSQGAHETDAAPPTAGPFGGMQPEERMVPRYSPAADSWASPAGFAGSGPLSSGLGAPQESPQQFAASDLIDPGALPSWAQGASAAPEPSFSSTSGWTNRQPAASVSSSDVRQQWGTQDAPPAVRGAASEWGASGRLPSPPANQRSFRDDERAGRVTGQGGFQDAGMADEYASSPWDQPRAQPSPAPNNRRPGAGRGEPGPRSDRRRGPPIPQQELPAWLQGGGPPHNIPDGQGRADGGFAQARGGRPMGPAGGYESDEWNAMPQADEQWASWDDGQRGGSGFDAGYADYQPPDADQQGRQRGGWRRFFGRK